MDIHLTASGTPGQIKEDLAKQLKALRTDKPDGWAATLAGVRDDVARELQQQGAENVQADLHITLEIKSLDAADVVRAFNAGQPLPGVPISEFDRQNKGEIEARRAAVASGGITSATTTLPVPGETPTRRRASDAATAAAEPASPPNPTK